MKDLLWVETSKKNPDFDIPCLVFCEIYGRFIATYECIGEFGGIKYGNWRYGEQLGILPPTHWIYLHDIPAPITRSDDVKTDKNHL